MKKFLFLSFVLILSACVHSPKQPEIIELEGGKYQISAISEEHWSEDFLAASLIEQASRYCSDQGGQFERVDVRKEPERRFNYSNVEILFRCRK